ncbi:NAD-dependent epimerase/dehydratase family protein [Mycolicibacterium sp. F2034L]|uniref:NAD-dependent epimerase/dehydratase family protein n=1 Tax=Mycolicibacterium sp. F2034L TaxID=2926422 RepID=UPI001FF2A061|nr:NAD-dependent epimerase/dehydratase family protein [Mycolicibacterium sp. F2034L]MCK0177108.1 NAD-dependent epimerase/dehydratase family protein [Mycolicibacterium sp. F2034L]
MGASLVTGAGGFIGSAVARRLLAEGHDVMTIDNLSSGRADNIPSGCTAFIADLRERATLDSLGNQRFDAIYHLAGQSGGISSFHDPVYDLQANAQSTLLLLEYAKRTGCPRFLYASSMAVYGNPSRLPAVEGDPLDPKTFYAVGKVASESYLRIFSEQGLACTALRLNNTYGPGQDLSNLNQGMASIFLGQALASRRIVVKGNLRRIRDFVFVDDVVDAFVKAADGARSGCFQIYNVSTSVGTSVGELLAMITSALPFDVQIEVEGSTPGDQQGIFCSFERIARDLNWTPRVDVPTGIRDMAMWALGSSAGSRRRDYPR